MQIEKMLDQNWRRFELWRRENSSFQTLDVPHPVDRVFIPGRVLELAQNLERVDVLATERGQTNLGILIYERLPYELSDKVLLEEFMKQRHESGIMENPSKPGDVPLGIDYKHVSNYDLLKTSQLSLQDRVILHYLVDIPPGYPWVAETRNYLDRFEDQRKGIGSSFYQRLEDVLIALGFGYLAGQIISPHPEFFLKHRQVYQDLPDHVKALLPGKYNRVIGDVVWTIKRL